MHAMLLALTSFNVRIDSTSVNGTAPNGTNQLSTATSTVTATGGGTPTYLWEYVSGDATISAFAGTTATPTWRSTGADLVHNAVWSCKVTASSGAIVYSQNVSIQITQGTP